MVQKGLNTWGFRKIVKEAIYLAKWNPNLAIDWMDDAYKTIQNELQLQEWTKAAKEINFIIDFKEKYDRVNHEEYWGHQLVKPRKLNVQNKDNKGK